MWLRQTGFFFYKLDITCILFLFLNFNWFVTISFILQLLKQSQIILNYLARETCLTTSHLDCIWLAAQVLLQNHKFFLLLFLHLLSSPQREFGSKSYYFGDMVRLFMFEFITFLLKSALKNRCILISKEFITDKDYAILLTLWGTFFTKKALQP